MSYINPIVLYATEEDERSIYPSIPLTANLFFG